jgi:plastocyanin
MRRSLFAGATLFAALALAACGGGASPAPASQPPASQPASQPAASEPAESGAAGGACESSTDTAAVTSSIADFTFEQPLTAGVGEVVGWTNDDTAPHTVTMDDGACDTGQIAAGASAGLVFNAAGTYAFHCEVHPNMTGSIEVTE